MDGGRIAPHDRARVSRIGGRGGTLPRRHPEAGGDRHPEPGSGQYRTGLPVLLFLGQRHLAMRISARHSIANQAGFASPHPTIP
jgi:hypothetical protein